MTDTSMAAARARLPRLAALAVVPMAILAFATGTSTALADPSPSISPVRISVDEPLGQGEDIRFPSLTIVNAGDEAADFIVEITNFANQVELRPDDLWFEVEPVRFNLEPGASQTVGVRMEIPRDAALGDYRILLRTRVDAPSDGSGGTVVRAAVATTVIFSVENRDFHFYDPVVDFFRDRAPFSYIGLALLLAAVAVEWFRRRFRLSFGVQRRE